MGVEAEYSTHCSGAEGRRRMAERSADRLARPERTTSPGRTGLAGQMAGYAVTIRVAGSHGHHYGDHAAVRCRPVRTLSLSPKRSSSQSPAEETMAALADLDHGVTGKVIGIAGHDVKPGVDVRHGGR